MNYLLIIICILSLLYKISNCQNTPCNDFVCCDIICDNCNQCNANDTLNFLCCEEIILSENRTCDLYPPPCVLDNPITPNSASSDDQEFEEQLVEFFTNIPNMVLLGIIIILFFIMIYACSCFDRRKPPVPYNLVMWEIPRDKKS